MNPPTATLVLFAPFAWLPSFRAAEIAWIAAGAVTILLSLRVVQRELGRSTPDMLPVAAMLLSGFPALSIWIEGQVIWFLMYPMTRAWAAYRNRACVQAGLWLGAVIAIKPVFAIAAPMLGLFTFISAGLLALGITVLTIAVTGIAPWFAWFTLGQQNTFIPWMTNASIWGAFSRALGAGPYTPFPLAAFGAWRAVVIVVCLCCVGWTFAARPADADRRFLAANVVAILVSPLGWVFYGVMLVGAATALWSASPLMRLGIAAAMVPISFLYPWGSSPAWWYASAGSLTCWSLFACLVAANGPRRVPAPAPAAAHSLDIARFSD
jgi:hypothetical protein